MLLLRGCCSAIVEIQRRQKKEVNKKIRSIWSRSPLANRESDVSHPHSMPTSLGGGKKKNLKQAFPASQEGTFRNTCFFYYYFFYFVCACCQIADACGVFTGTLGWAVVLAVSGRPTDWQPARLSLEDSYWGGVAEWTIRDCDVH